MADETKNDWGKSVAGIVIKDNKILLARHTYGAGKGLLITPGGYIKSGESPIDAVKREVMEETGVTVNPTKLIAMRFNEKDWYAAFLCEYISGTPRSDNDENCEVSFIDLDEALIMPDVPDLSKQFIKAAKSDNPGLSPKSYNPQRETFGSLSLFTTAN